MPRYYDGYYEDHDGDDVVVHLDYSDPEPSLFRVTAKKASSRPQLSLKRDSRNTGSRSDQKVRFKTDEKSQPLMQEYRDDLYSNSAKKVNIQDQKYNDHAPSHSLSKDSSVSSLSHGAIDLSGKASDTSFDLFASLLTDHISPKIRNNSYVLDEVDIAYFDAILPESLRMSFVTAVNKRFSRLPKYPGKYESELEQHVREAHNFGLGLPKEKNFLLGGGQKLKGGEIRMDILKESYKKEMSSSHSTDDEQFRTDSEWDEDNSEFEGPADANELSSTDLMDLIKSLDHLSDKDVSLLKDSGLPKNQMRMIEQALASKKASRAKRMKEENQNLEIIKASTDDAAKKIHDDFIPSNDISNDSRINVSDEVKNVKSVNTSQKVTSTHDSTKRRNKWKDGLFDALAHGCFHPFLVLTCCAPLYALAQVMTRLQLNSIGKPATDEQATKQIYRNLNTLVAGWFVAIVGSMYYFSESYFQNGTYNIASIVIFATFNLILHIFTVVITSNTRTTLREMCDIPDDFTTDFTLSFMYLRLVIAQMGRQTANYKKERAYICTGTGLRERSRSQQNLIIISKSNSFASIV